MGKDRGDFVDRTRTQSPLFPVNVGALTRRSQIQKQFGDRKLCQGVPIAHQSCHQSNKKYFQQGVLLDHLDLSEGLSPILGGFDEQSTQCPSNNTDENEGTELEVFPVDQISDFEHHNLVGTIWIEEFERQSGNNAAKESAKQCLGWKEV